MCIGLHGEAGGTKGRVRPAQGFEGKVTKFVPDVGTQMSV